MGEDLLGGSVAPGRVGTDGVIDPFPRLPFLVELGDRERAGDDLIELLRVRAVSALDRKRWRAFGLSSIAARARSLARGTLPQTICMVTLHLRCHRSF